MQKHTHRFIAAHTCTNRATGNIYNTASAARRASLWFCVRRPEKKRLLTPLPGLPLMTGSVRVQGQLQLPFLSSQCEKNCRSRPPPRRSHNRPEPTSVSEGTRADACSGLFFMLFSTCDWTSISEGPSPPPSSACLVSAGVRKMHQIKQPL